MNFFNKIIFDTLKFINFYINNLGISIILITILIKIIIYPILKINYISTLKLNLIKNEIDNINKKYIDKSKINEEIMKLYKREKINPMFGILLLIIQIPLFLSLYYVLTLSNDFKNAHFILWIKDLSLKDPYYVLPIIMGISLFLLQIDIDNYKKINMHSIIISFIFTLCFLYVPSGLIIYYITNNLITFIQQLIIFYDFKKNIIEKKIIN